MHSSLAFLALWSPASSPTGFLILSSCKDTCVHVSPPETALRDRPYPEICIVANSLSIVNKGSLVVGYQ